MPLIDYLTPYAMGAIWSIKVVLVFLLPMLLIELLRPAHRLHLPTLLFNAFYAPVYLTFAAALLHPVASTLSPWIPVNVLGWSLQNAPTWKIVLLVSCYLLMFDFFYYWFHRMQHGWPVMWRFHRFHHADVTVAVLSATRHHWIEETLRYFVMSIPLLLLFGSPERTFPWLGILTGVLGLFIHWNAPLPLGPLTPVMVGPQYHRIHHSIEPRHYDKNFAVIFPFWDRLFGTQCMPEGREFPITGLSDARYSNGWRLLWPFPPGKG